MKNAQIGRSSLTMEVYVGESGTLFQMLPPELCGPDEGCCCKDCKALREEGKSPPTFNCLAASPKGLWTWTVHLSDSTLATALKSGALKQPRGKR